jgi:transcriptional regulator with XRE-family HTH domain
VAARSPAHRALGRSIQDLRLERGLSQEGLALESGLHRTYIGGVERGERNPSFEALMKIAAALGIDLSQVLLKAERP